ncbi:succinate dehydrogenase [Candidatus Formimonas warabiya]|uniref:Succinate dehydrogenase n=1 Tax=Formimonas warabiya TaxID=1761012 RepID=A0A3G1KPL9_FORW1|nr:succinate dehydrogenase [Candidatus Formimonas warabiya]ATW24414.1 hypothetical protein DCMF_06110 [Candidatus Formimonas warabiya]ATW26080.1 hypothetical protein DCMF_16025 [Candidatus Formimonas warabiya]
MGEKSNYLIRKVHSLLGIIPVGIFLMVHLSLNSTVFFGGYANYLVTVEWMKGLPLIMVAEVVIIGIPILFHALYGLWIVYVAKNNVLKFPYLRNWAFYLQRITAVITLVFLLAHVVSLRFLEHEPAAVIQSLAGSLHHPLFFILYAVGVLSALFHFANGLFTFLISWGIAEGDKAQRIFTWCSGAVFAALGILGISILSVIARF